MISMTPIRISLTLALAVVLAGAAPLATAQKVQLGEVLVVNTPAVKPGIDAGAFEAQVLSQTMPAWAALGSDVESHFFRADRGKSMGSYWLVWSFPTTEARARSLPPDGSGFSRASQQLAGEAARLPESFVSAAGGYTDYELIGADKIAALPEVELLGVHYIQIRPDKADAFDAFVRDTVHPALVGKIPGMDLLYYKGVRGEMVGSYLLIFAIETHEDRARYWPTGSSETQTLKDAFAPLKPIAEALKDYQVPGTYLEADGGAAAAIFESIEWTDFAILK